MASKKRKAEGEFVWVMDGKTEYHGRLVEPTSVSKARGDDEIEVQWGHNGAFEWVTFDRVKIEKTNRRRSTSRATASPSKKGAAKKQTAKRTRKTPEKISSDDKKTTPKKKQAGKKSQKDDATKKKATTGKRNKASQEAKNKSDNGDSATETPSGVPSRKRQKKGHDAKGPLLPEGFFANIAAKALSAKEAVVSGAMGLYKSVVGS